MNLRKKILSVALAAVMAFSTMIATVSAEEPVIPSNSPSVLSDVETENGIIKSIVFSHNGVEDASVVIGEPFDITVETTTQADQIFLRGESGAYIAKSVKNDYTEENGIRTFQFSTPVQTPGGRRLTVQAYRDDQPIDSYIKFLRVLPSESNGTIKSVEYLVDGEVTSTLTTSKPFDVRVVTTTDVASISLLSEEGQYDAPISLTYTDEGDTRTFIYTASVPTPGNRTFTIVANDEDSNPLDYFRKSVYMEIAQDYDIDVQFLKDGVPVTEVYSNELFDVKVTSPVKLEIIYVNNEKMKTVETYNLSEHIINGQYIYDFQIKLGSALKGRLINVYCGQYDETEVSGQRTIGGKVMSVDVLPAPQDPDDYDVTFAIAGREISSAIVNQNFDVTFAVPKNVTDISLWNENDVGMGLLDLDSTVVGDQRIFTCHMSVGSPGQRTFTLRALVDGTNWMDIKEIPFVVVPLEDYATSFSLDGQEITSVKCNQDFNAIFVMPENVSYLVLYNERGAEITLMDLENTMIDGKRVFTCHMSIATPGERIFSLYAVVDKKQVKIKDIPITIISTENPDDYQVTFSIDGKEISSAAVNQDFDVTFVTPVYVSDIELRNERGNGMGLLDLQDTVVNGKRVFTCHMSIGSIGERTFTLDVLIDGILHEGLKEIHFTVTP